jgi:hypothetical protein
MEVVDLTLPEIIDLTGDDEEEKDDEEDFEPYEYFIGPIFYFQCCICWDWCSNGYRCGECVAIFCLPCDSQINRCPFCRRDF